MSLTVLIPLYNTAPQHLLEAVYSIIMQDDGNDHRILLINDGSDNPATLNALDIINSTNYLYKHLGKHVQKKSSIEIITTENRGTPAALNLGHSKVDTEYVALMGSDDVCDPTRFRLQLDYIRRFPEVDVIGTNLFSFYSDDIFRKSLFTSKHEEVPLNDLHGTTGWRCNHGTVIYKNASVLKVGGYNEAYKRGQDVELWSRMLAAGCKIRNVTKVLYAWRRYRAEK